MSFDSLLIQTCTIQRYTEGAADSYGMPAQTWADFLTDEPCRLSYPKGRQRQDATEVTPVDAVLFLNEYEITEHDRAVVETVTYEILHVAHRVNGVDEHHLELDLKRVIS